MTLRVLQVGMNTADLAASALLYTEAFGFQNAGAQILSGQVIRIQGLDETCRALMWWLVGNQPLFQLEFFHHTRPVQRPSRPNLTPADHGWRRLGVAVADFDAALSVLARYGIAPLAGEVVVDGLRRTAVRDPYVGLILEVMEDGPAIQRLTGAPAPAIVYAASSVSDLGAALGFYQQVLGLQTRPIEDLHGADSDRLWGLENASRTGFIVDGGGIKVEIVEYASPAGRPRPADYRASDQGIVNVAFGGRSKEPVASALARLKEAGFEPPYIVENEVLAAYITDAEREIELVNIPEEVEAILGFAPAGPFLGAG